MNHMFKCSVFRLGLSNFYWEQPTLYSTKYKIITITKKVHEVVLSILRTSSIQLIIGRVIGQACIAHHGSSLMSTFTLRKIKVVPKST